MDLDQTPYLDFPWSEYPPLPACHYVFALPQACSRAETLTRDTVQTRKSVIEAAVIGRITFASFRIKKCCFAISQPLACFVATNMLKRRPAYCRGWASLAYTLSTGILNEVLYDRFDAGLLVLAHALGLP